MPEDMKAAMNLTKLVFYLLVFLNAQACLLYYIVNINKDEFLTYDGVARSAQWYPPYSWINFPDNEVYDKEQFEKYAYFFYQSIMFLGVGEIGPVNKVELVAALIFLIISLIITTHL